jgi:hypothetical protein
MIGNLEQYLLFKCFLILFSALLKNKLLFPIEITVYIFSFHRIHIFPLLLLKIKGTSHIGVKYIWLSEMYLKYTSLQWTLHFLCCIHRTSFLLGTNNFSLCFSLIIIYLGSRDQICNLINSSPYLHLRGCWCVTLCWNYSVNERRGD